MRVYRFEKNLKMILAQRGLSAAEVAEKMGVNNSTVSCWCSGRYTPTVFNAFLLSEALGVGLDELVCGEGGKDEFNTSTQQSTKE
jgi:transcriptional regulator with XRE-family HTH domain